MTHRFFIPPDWLTPPLVSLRDETAYQIKAVLRLQAGDDIIVLDNSGFEWGVRLTEVSRDVVRGRIVGQQPVQGEPGVQLTLYQGTLKAQKFEWVLQKGTELGVSRFVPTLCQRSVVSRAEDLDHKQVRWQRIIQEAAEQSGRGKLPVLEMALPLPAAIEQASQAAAAGSLLLMPWEEAEGPPLKAVLAGVQAKSVALFIGPEGGFTAAEAAIAQAAGVQLVKLGPRILRAETAGLAVCATVLYELGEWT